MKLTDRQKKLLILAFDPAATTGEAINALRVLFRDWIHEYSDGHELVHDLETEKIVYREKENPYGNVLLGFGKFRGRAIRDVPISYLIWVRDNFEELWPETREAIEKYLDGRD
jgi:putative quorum-sensing-regulated virulence factor